jgi:hypothetical protein
VGEAKRNRDKRAADLLAWLERWDFPPSDAEANLVREIEKLESVQVRRYPGEVLRQMRMPPNQCHANTQFMVDNDPDGRCRQVSGWLFQVGNYVLHSVVERGEDLFCVTPYPVPVTDTFSFIPDPKIEWVENSKGKEAYRDGYRIEYGVRSDPLETIRINEVVRERIKNGIHPLKAGEPPFD